MSSYVAGMALSYSLFVASKARSYVLPVAGMARSYSLFVASEARSYVLPVAGLARSCIDVANDFNSFFCINY